MKKRYLMLAAISVLALSLAACGKKTDEQPNEAEAQVETSTDVVQELANEITTNPDEKDTNTYGGLIINNGSTNDHANTLNDQPDASNDTSEGDQANPDDPADTSGDTSMNNSSEEFTFSDDVVINVPDNYTAQVTNKDDNGNPRALFTSPNGVRLYIDMTDTMSDEATYLQEKLTYLLENPDGPYNAATTGLYNDTALTNETYTILGKYYSNKSETSVYTIKMTSEDDDNPYCYYIVASDIINTSSNGNDCMMLVRTTDFTEDEAVTKLAQTLFGN